MELTIEQASENKMSWEDVIRYFRPEATDDECEYILWNETCHPFDNRTTFTQLVNYLSPSTQNKKP